MRGTYTVEDKAGTGGTKNFDTLKEALTALKDTSTNTACTKDIDSNIVINVLEDQTGQHTINEIEGTDSKNTVTIQAVGDITIDGNEEKDNVVIFNNTSFVTLKGFNITNSKYSAIKICKGSHYNTVINNNIFASNTLSGNEEQMSIIYIGKETAGSIDSNNKIISNKIRSTIYPIKNAIQVSYANNTDIINNSITITTSTNDSTAIYVKFTDGENKIYNNSVYISNQDFLLNLENSNSETNVLNIKNNIFYTATSGKSVIKISQGNNTEINMDNNLMFAPNITNAGNFSYIDGGPIHTFEEYQNNTVFDQNSVNEDPNFTDFVSGDLSLLEQPSINGIVLTDITTDITNKIRNITEPTIGAYEF